MRKIDKVFIAILAMTKETLFDYNVKVLKAYGYEVESYFDETEGYIFARGTMPVCLCAHMDKVPWYKNMKTYQKRRVGNDIRLSSSQGIGGDDRCGVYMIHRMLEYGYRPSVLFTMGEEIGCRGANKFCNDHDKDFLKDINAFIQIDRRGNKDIVKYSDENFELVKAIEPFGFEYAYGSCTDISVLMPHFKISGVNISSGYYHEHTGVTEYVSINDVDSIIERLDAILHSNIFEKKYNYIVVNRYQSSFGFNSLYSGSRSKQLPLFEDPDLLTCSLCGELNYAEDLIEIDNEDYDFICDLCEDTFIKKGYIKCTCCGALNKPTKDPAFVENVCTFCGAVIDNNEDNL